MRLVYYFEAPCGASVATDPSITNPPEPDCMGATRERLIRTTNARTTLIGMTGRSGAQTNGGASHPGSVGHERVGWFKKPIELIGDLLLR